MSNYLGYRDNSSFANRNSDISVGNGLRGLDTEFINYPMQPSANQAAAALDLPMKMSDLSFQQKKNQPCNTNANGVTDELDDLLHRFQY